MPSLIRFQDMPGYCSRCILITAPAGVCQTRTKRGFSNSKFTHTWPHLRPEFSLLCGVLGTRVLETKVLVLVSSLSQKFSWKMSRIS